MWLRGCCPRPSGRGPVGPKHFVATTNWSRRPWSQRPTISSVRPTVVRVAAERIHVGGVEERDAALGGPSRIATDVGFVALEPERHRPEADARDLEAGAAESNVLHRTIMPP